MNANIFAALHQSIAVKLSVIDEISEGIERISAVTVEFLIRDTFGRLPYPLLHSWESVRKGVERRPRAKGLAGAEILIFVPAPGPHPKPR